MGVCVLLKASRVKHRKAAEETFFEVQNLIRKEVWKLVRKYPISFGDAMEEAQAIFITAYTTYDGSGSVPFLTWVKNQVSWGVMDEIRRRATEGARYQEIAQHGTEEGSSRMGIESIPSTYRDWSPSDLLKELSEDAKIVTKLVLETPTELAGIIEGKGGQARNYRSSIRDYLDKLGWTARRVAESFSEIKQVLG